MRYDLSDILVEAIKNNEPIIIVEGKDDQQIYYKLTQKINPSIQIYPINLFEDFGPGCENVIEAITKLQPKFLERTDNIKFILGVIDKDSRPYRGTMPSNHLKGIFITKFYSIETYFATIKNLIALIAKITFQSPHKITPDLLAFVEQNIESSIENLYYISLEALKHSCVENYSTTLSYDTSENEVVKKKGQDYLMGLISPKKEFLDLFAIEKSITIQDIKHICKGKWFLYNYVYRAYYNIEQLSQKCRNAEIQQCESCKVGNYDDCLYKLKKGKYPYEYIYDDMFEFIDFNEMKDIMEALEKLGK